MSTTKLDCDTDRDAVKSATATPTARCTIAELLLLAGLGDQAAFDQLYIRMFRRVLGLSRRLLIDPAEAEDVTQEVFLEVWTKASAFDPARGSAIGWLLGVTHHRAIDRIRTSEGARRRDLTYHHRTYRRPRDEGLERIIATADAVEVAAAMNQLSGLRREALIYAFYADHSHQQASVLLGIPLGTFKSRVRDALTALRTVLTADAN